MIYLKHYFRLIAETGDIRTEYIEENEKARERFMAQKIEEESINLKLLEQNPQLKEELEIAAAAAADQDPLVTTNPCFAHACLLVS